MQRGSVRRAILALDILLGLGLFDLAGADPRLLPAAADSSALQTGLEALQAGDREVAAVQLERAIETQPEDPLAPLFRLKLWWWCILEGDGAAESSFMQDFQLVRSTAEARLALDPHDVRALYALGEAHCTLGRLQGIRGQGWAAVRSHQRGTPLLESALALDPELVAPLVSLGVYHYYAARAPAFLRFVGRFLSVEADRQRGLQELWRAATSPGWQQHEATFFLVEILAGMEDDGVEALPLALALHARSPRSLPSALSLATVLLSLDRPDLALRALEPLARDDGAVAARFFMARTLCVSGRADDALAILDRMSREELQSVQWLSGWHSYYRGLAEAQLGRVEAARAAFETAVNSPEVADLRSHAERELERHASASHRDVRLAEANWMWGEDQSASPSDMEAVLTAAGRGSDRDSRRRALLLLGVMSLELGMADRAAQILHPLVEDVDTDETWLAVRPRVRLLQALWRSGQFERAQEAAAQMVPLLGNWGSNRQLELLVQTCLQPPSAGETPQSLAAVAAHRPLRLRFKDTGWTHVDLALEIDPPLVLPMRLHGRFWEVEFALPAGTYRYRFLLEGTQALPDPSANEFEFADGGTWSVIRVQAAPGS